MSAERKRRVDLTAPDESGSAAVVVDEAAAAFF
jgi:hypothetical protein